MTEQCKREKCKGFLKCNPDLNGWLKNKDLHLAACESQKFIDRLVAWIKRNPETTKKVLAVFALSLLAIEMIPFFFEMLREGFRLIEHTGIFTDVQVQLFVGVGNVIFGFLWLYALAKCFVIISRIIFKNNTKNEAVTND